MYICKPVCMYAIMYDIRMYVHSNNVHESSVTMTTWYAVMVPINTTMLSYHCYHDHMVTLSW